MEKTNNNIPSAEELAIYIKEATVSVTNTYEQSPVVLMVDDSIIGTLGNFSASIGKAKSKKTFNVAALTAAGDVLIDGPYDDLHIAIKITKGGAETAAKFAINLVAL